MIMEWRNNLITGLQWSDDIINREGKEQVAHQLAARVKDGEVTVSYTHLTLPTIA